MNVKYRNAQFAKASRMRKEKKNSEALQDALWKAFQLISCMVLWNGDEDWTAEDMKWYLNSMDEQAMELENLEKIDIKGINQQIKDAMGIDILKGEY